jgi:acetyl/propionyl-CoA carboxylase alpha subunit
MRKVLIANRGEIAVRIIKAASRLGLKTVVALAKCEANTLPAKMADECFMWEDDALEKSYLNVDAIIGAALKHNADAIHPGYGFLSENHLLAEACHKHGIVFVGPKPHHLKQMGDKQQARRIAQEAGVPVVPGWELPIDELMAIADSLPYPLLVKAAMGGGGKGMLPVLSKEMLHDTLLQAGNQAKRYFGDDRVFVERLFHSPRHIEVQLMADHFGNVVHLFERECSIQRRHQKIVEEAPAPGLSDSIRQKLTDDALKIARHIGYCNAGTIEFLLDSNGNHYFLEMNTRIQVEHPVTECITGIDIVCVQFGIASGKPLSFSQSDVRLTGHAIESRLYAESPLANFQPTPGKINVISFPEASVARVDAYFDSPHDVASDYDPMLAKIITHASSRAEAINKHQIALEQTGVIGIETNLAYLFKVLNHPQFRNGDYHTGFCTTNSSNLLNYASELNIIYLAPFVIWKLFGHSDGYWRVQKQVSLKINGIQQHVSWSMQGDALELSWQNQTFTITDWKITGKTISFQFKNKLHRFTWHHHKNELQITHEGIAYNYVMSDYLPPYEPDKQSDNSLNGKSLHAPIPGRIVKVNVQEGSSVCKGDTLLVLEAMKLENHLQAWKNGVVKKLNIANGHQVKANEILLTIED